MLKTIAFSIVLGVLMPIIYLLGYTDGHKEVKALKAEHDEADKESAAAVANLKEIYDARCEARIEEIMDNMSKG